MKLKNLYFLRHGETEMNRQLRCQGQINEPLNETGLKQAHRAAAVFRDIKLDAIFSSPLSRAIDSATQIAKEKELEILTLDWLSEINHGQVEGMNREDADRVFPGLLDTWLNEPHRAVFPGGETLQEVEARVRTGLALFIQECQSESVLMVTHQIISGVSRCLLQDIPLEKVWQDKLVNGDHFHFCLTPEMVGRL